MCVSERIGSGSSRQEEKFSFFVVTHINGDIRIVVKFEAKTRISTLFLKIWNKTIGNHLNNFHCYTLISVTTFKMNCEFGLPSHKVAWLFFDRTHNFQKFSTCFEPTEGIQFLFVVCEHFNCLTTTAHYMLQTCMPVCLRQRSLA